jgi:molybdopterin-synthase adenylyltransferase
MFKKEEIERYKRQIAIPGFGEAGQSKLKKARILIAGAGGLGSPAALYLAAAGIGSLRIVDCDKVDLSNLNRQLLHSTPDTGRRKVVSAGEKLKVLNPHVDIETVKDRISSDNIDELLTGVDGIVDAMDNLETRYILNKAAVKADIPLFHGAVSGFEGRALTVLPRKSACLMCLYNGATVKTTTPVIGVTPGVIGCIQTTETIKYLTGLGSLLTDRLLIYDGFSMCFSEIKLSRDLKCPHCGTMT